MNKELKISIFSTVETMTSLTISLIITNEIKGIMRVIITMILYVSFCVVAAFANRKFNIYSKL